MDLTNSIWGRAVRSARCLRFAVAFQFLAGSAGLAAAGDVADSATAFHAAVSSVHVDQLYRHIEVLADDTYEGRAAGSRGGHAAAGYLTSELKKLGLKGGAAGGGYYQPFDNGSRNILALLEGSDEKLKDEIVLVCAHYDHVGYGNSQNSFGPTGYIHNGADDNASGTSALLEVMEAFTLLPERPKRTILFALWDAEEAGLIGSKYWVDHPTVPLNRIRCSINADMLGRMRGRKLEVYGTRTAMGLRSLISQQNAQSGANLLIDFLWEMKANSDHYTFYSRGIPSIMLHTGLHNDYHRPSDDVEKINAEGLEQVTRLMTGVVFELANSPEPLAPFRAESRRESSRDRQLLERPLAQLPARLGIVWKEPVDPERGIEITSISPGSPASRGGLRKGDRLIEFAGRPSNEFENFRALVMSAESPVRMVVEREGSEEPLELNMALGGHPVRLGLAWQMDTGEPNCAVLVRVTPGLPAAEAGLRVLDRVYSVDGHKFTTSDEFRQLITAVPAPISLEVENRGVLRTVVLHPEGEASGESL